MGTVTMLSLGIQRMRLVHIGGYQNIHFQSMVHAGPVVEQLKIRSIAIRVCTVLAAAAHSECMYSKAERDPKLRTIASSSASECPWNAKSIEDCKEDIPLSLVAPFGEDPSKHLFPASLSSTIVPPILLTVPTSIILHLHICLSWGDSPNLSHSPLECFELH